MSTTHAHEEHAKHGDAATIASLREEIATLKKSHAKEIADLHKKGSVGPVHTAKDKLAKFAEKFAALQKAIDLWDNSFSKHAASEAFALDKVAADYVSKNVPDYADYFADQPPEKSAVNPETVDCVKASALCAFRAKRLNEALAVAE